MNSGYFSGYDINANPAMMNSAAHAAMWYVATLIPDVLSSLNQDTQQDDTIKFSETFFAPFELYQDEGYKRILVGLLQSTTQKDDSVISEIMMNRMFKDASYKGNFKINVLQNIFPKLYTACLI